MTLPRKDGYDGTKRTPPPEWVAALRAVSPITDHLSWLHLVWEAGDPWEPINRWTLWQMRPKSNPVSNMWRAALTGDAPRSSGHPCFAGYCLCDVKANRWVDGPESAHGISQLKWDLYKETGCEGDRWWVIQGSKGGHRYRYDAIEEVIAKMMGRDPHPPTMGSLPYLEPNALTWRAVAEDDQVRQWKMMTGYLVRPRGVQRAEDQAKCIAAARKIAAWIDEQWDEPVDRFVHALKHDSTIPRTPRWALGDFDAEAEEQAFEESAAHLLPTA